MGQTIPRLAKRGSLELLITQKRGIQAGHGRVITRIIIARLGIIARYYRHLGNPEMVQ